MRPFAAFMKKEFLESVRTGRLVILMLLFVLFGIMNPAIAKLTPWLMEMYADTMAESGLIIADIQVDAMTSWAQFFKNIPMALIAFVLLSSDTFTKEYKNGTLLLVLTKGLARFQVVLGKSALLLSLWTFGYWLCFAITYGYNAYFWDNSIAGNLFPAALIWWLFGVWVICLMILFSALLRNSTEVTLCIGGTALLAYLCSLLPKLKAYVPTTLMNAVSLLSGMEGNVEENIGGIDTFQKAVTVTVILSVTCLAVSIPVMNKKQL